MGHATQSPSLTTFASLQIECTASTKSMEASVLADPSMSKSKVRKQSLFARLQCPLPPAAIMSTKHSCLQGLNATHNNLTCTCSCSHSHHNTDTLCQLLFPKCKPGAAPLSTELVSDVKLRSSPIPASACQSLPVRAAVAGQCHLSWNASACCSIP